MTGGEELSGLDEFRATDEAENEARLAVEETRRKAPARHPAQVTADRLTDHLDAYADQITQRERDAAYRVVTALQAIAEGER